MGFTLIIVESPAKCKKIENYLGPPYKCIASFGHIRQFSNGLKSINKKENYKPTYKLIPTKSRYIENLRDKIRRADEIILATDDDREGEAISWHICDAFNLSLTTTKRIIFHEITKTAIVNAVKNPSRLDINKVNAQKSRQILDLMVGFTLSPLLWKQISRSSGLSAGRCQTPALRIVYENQKEIDESPGKKSYNTIGYFTDKNLPFSLTYCFDNEKDMEHFLEESVGFGYKYNCLKPRESVKKAPRPFTTSILQQASSNELHYSPKKTMQLAQILYEAGYITYMRTDSKTYSIDFVKTVKKHILSEYGKEFIHCKIDNLTMRKKKKNDTAQEAHEAIRPTSITRKKLPDGFNPQGKRLYHLIWRNTLESCISAAIYYVIKATITAPLKMKYQYTTELVKFPGWKIVDGYEKENPLYTYLQKYTKKVDYSKITSKFTLKELKTHYTEARLVQMLEKKGIGRPSTFSSLISKIQDRNYVKKENVSGRKISCTDYELIDDVLEEIETSKVIGNERNKLVIQPLGILVIEFLLKYFENFFKYSYTKEMEDKLDKIAQGKMIWYKLCKDCDEQLNIQMKKSPITNNSSIKIDENHTYLIGKYGPVIKYTNGDDTKFLTVKDKIDLHKLRNGEYSLEDIVVTSNENNLGNFNVEDVIVKKGKYGLYVVHGKKKISLKMFKETLTLENIIPYLTGEKHSNPNIVRVINNYLSVRKGKWGLYIYYKTEKMKKPHFIPIKDCPLDVVKCEKKPLLAWIKTL